VHVFIDDSGDAGMKFDRGSSRHLVMAACIFSDADEIERTAETIRNLRTQLGRGERWEFKYSKTSVGMKDAFFGAVAPHRFWVRAIIIDKQILYSSHLASVPRHLQNYAIKQLLTHTYGTVTDAKLVIDGGDRRTFGASDLSYLRREINQQCPGTIRKAVCEESDRNMLIQLADMVAGAVHRNAKQAGSAAAHMRVISQKAAPPKGSLWRFK
jgi:hypothetical protein